MLADDHEIANPNIFETYCVVLVSMVEGVDSRALRFMVRI
jgi:hypothetical protein